ncbi:helix-turn-helix transcriptional regulator [Brevibacillus sp. MCWH]|jgi:transcriptional regulator with XRE-family HTH domain|uniref:helix-turn-helix domain-containing protein n=1 Tax=Brevibacillus sp. MCWH TaxID=2508871 RepID=UPI001491FD00|nr:helix-turn-helix transcriptional regulator [Brevibacillus sp. MCWH]NNV01657.1 XRE family transcriptional regulator [Brevibacillus sp. MCWH]
MNFTLKEQYIMLRKRKKIRLRQIAEALDCAISTLSDYERGTDMSPDKIKKYRDFIDNYETKE